jgi:hypothetical protein
VGARQRHQHLHHPGLKILASVARLDFAQRRPHAEVAKLKVVLTGEAGRADRLQQGWALVHDEIIRRLGKSSAIHQALVLSNAAVSGCNRATNWRVPERQAGAKTTA